MKVLSLLLRNHGQLSTGTVKQGESLNESPELIAQESQPLESVSKQTQASMKVLSLLLRNGRVC